MTKPMSLADRLSGLNLRSGCAKSARARRRRVNQRWRVAAQISLLEERCMMSADLGGIPLPTPADDFVPPSQVMSQVNIQANKTITIHNDTEKPIFPIIEDVNTGQNPDNNDAYYDPNDTPGQEYRLYAGYVTKVKGTDQNFLGIPAGASITLTLPMVFWDAGTIQVVADTPDTRQRFLASFNPGGNVLGQPFLYNSSDSKEAVVSAKLKGKNLGGAQGTELLYTTTDPASKGIISDAPSQLLEFTIRDQSMPATPTTHFTNSVDYDISYINNLYLPVAMEADKANVGYIGTLDDTTTFKTAVKAFEVGKVLNGYFGGNGWPFYHTSDPAAPIDKAALVKLVGAQNIFGDNTAASSYNLLLTMLSSSAGNQASGGVLPAANNDYAERDLADLWFGWLNYYSKVSSTPITGNLLQLMQQTQVPVQPVTITPDPSTSWMTANGKVSDTQFANAFAYTVYQVMNAFSNAPGIVFNNNAQPALRASSCRRSSGTPFRRLPTRIPRQVCYSPRRKLHSSRVNPTPTCKCSRPANPITPCQTGKTGIPIQLPRARQPRPKNGLSANTTLIRLYGLCISISGHILMPSRSNDRFGNIMVDDASGFTIAVGGPEGINDTKPYGTVASLRRHR